MADSPVEIKLSIPCLADYVVSIRLAISGIAARMDFDIDQIEDIKVAVSEACTNAIQHAYSPGKDPNDNRIDIDAQVLTDRLTIRVTDYGNGFDKKILGTPFQKEKSMEKFGLGLGITFIKSLMDEADIHTEPGKGTIVTMSKRVMSAPISETVV